MSKTSEELLSKDDFINNPDWVFINPDEPDGPGHSFVFEEVGIKEERTIIIKIHGWYTTVFINKDRYQYLLTVRYKEELDLFLRIMRNEESILNIMSGLKSKKEFLKEKIKIE